jgi:hypothetical protein
MKERLIWRPNEILPEHWEAMSREEQIQWWKDHAKTPLRKPHMKKVIRLYQRGDMPPAEFCSCVMTFAAPDEIAEFVRVCPPELMALLKEELAHSGPDESKWPRTYHLSCYAPWVTAEQIAESQRQEQEQIWNGVRLLKQYLQ